MRRCSGGAGMAPASPDTGYGAGRAALEARVWAIEGCQGIGGPIARRLLADGEQVVDAPPKLSADRRWALGEDHTQDDLPAAPAAHGSHPRRREERPVRGPGQGPAGRGPAADRPGRLVLAELAGRGQVPDAFVRWWARASAAASRPGSSKGLFSAWSPRPFADLDRVLAEVRYGQLHEPPVVVHDGSEALQDLGLTHWPSLIRIVIHCGQRPASGAGPGMRPVVMD